MDVFFSLLFSFFYVISSTIKTTYRQSTTKSIILQWKMAEDNTHLQVKRKKQRKKNCWKSIRNFQKITLGWIVSIVIGYRCYYYIVQFVLLFIVAARAHFFLQNDKSWHYLAQKSNQTYCVTNEILHIKSLMTCFWINCSRFYSCFICVCIVSLLFIFFLYFYKKNVNIK